MRECRGLVLDENFDLVARGFRRFFNYGEVDDPFNWQESVVCSEKVDGSLIILYFWNGKWRINTRFSFGDGQINDSPYTWESLVSSLLDFSKLNPELTYVMELCSRYNKVVRDYPTPSLFLLSVFDRYNELYFNETMTIGKSIGVSTSNSYKVSSYDDVEYHLNSISSNDQTFEGFVLRDRDNNRFKVKSLLYLSLHRLANNGNLCSPKNIIPLILDGEIDEVITYFPEMKDDILNFKNKIDKIFQEIDNVWFCHWDEQNQKKFAIAVCKDTKYTAPLFSAKKLGGHPKDYITTDYLVKLLEK